MSQYYFAVASLPHLTYNMEKVPTVEQFLEICERNLKPRDLELIKAAIFKNIESEKTGNKILDNLFIWEKNLRNRLVFLRAKKRNEPPEKYMRKNPELFIDDRFIREAFEDDSPLDAEDILNRERWAYLDNMELGHYFDEIKLVIYYLKLQILWRKKDLNKEKGAQRFNEILEKFSSEEIPYDNII
jgi:hypothetical protein